MKTTWPLAAAMALALAAPAFAAPDPIGYTASDGVNAVAVTAASPLPVTGPTGASAMQVQGTAASGVAAAGNPFPLAVVTAGTTRVLQGFSALGDGDGGNSTLPVGIEILSTAGSTSRLRDVSVAQTNGIGTPSVALT